MTIQPDEESRVLEPKGVAPRSDATARTDRLPGLDSLRFYAALSVMFAHVPLNLLSVGMPTPPAWPRLVRFGETAVLFFFTLSGFLITYLLLREHQRTRSIDLWAFNVRRALRIWPLYYAVVAGSFLFYWVLLPVAGVAHQPGYEPLKIGLLYLFFLPHLASSIAFVEGVLTPLWSIGVEEHFYLSWAPLVKRLHAHVPALCGATFLLSIGWQAIHLSNLFHLDETLGFVLKMKFHYMAAGGFLGWAFVQRRTQLLDSWFLTRRTAQVVLALGLAIDLFTTWLEFSALALEVIQPLLFAWLIAEVGINPRRLFPYGGRWTEAAGKVTYGFYLLHVPAVYATTAIAQSVGASTWPRPVFLAAYFVTACGLAMLFALTSWTFFERPILELKKRYER